MIKTTKKKQKRIISDVAEFTIQSGKVHLTDPCYDTNTWCGNYNIPAQNGVWEAEVTKSDEGDWGCRIASLRAWVKGLKPGNRAGCISLPNEVGVDSGQAGIFDSSVYPDKGARYDEGDSNKKFYDTVCDITLGEDGWGVYNGAGVVSSSGFGDGGYEAVCKKSDKGEIIFVEIKFL